MAIPTGLTSNRVAGADFLYRRSSFRPGKQLNVFGYAQRSFSSKLGDDNSFGAEVEYPNEPFGFDLRYKQIGAELQAGARLRQSARASARGSG